MKKIGILGSTGSIGTQTLDIVRNNPDLQVVALAAGNIVDLMEPGAGTILRLVNGPRLVSKGQWFVYFIVLVYSVYIAAMVLFAEEMFRWKFVFLARNADRIEPSDWALAERKIGWAIGTVGALIFYMMGLR